MPSRKNLWAILVFAASAALGACHSENKIFEDETGKYISGPDDPSLSVTDEDKAGVEKILAAQEAKDREAGLRREPVIQTAQAGAQDSAAPTSSARSTEPGVVDMGFLRARAPEGWIVEQPSSRMRLAQLRIPPGPGDPAPGEVVVTFFGGDAGGVDANLERWYGQFEQPGGGDSRAAAVVKPLDDIALETVIVDLGGTMKEQQLPGMPETPRRENWRLNGAIVKASEGLVFVKITGPDATIQANREKTFAFLRSFEPTSTDSAPSAASAAALPAPRVAAASAASPPAAESLPGAKVSDGSLVVDMRLATATAPKGWIEIPPTSSMRLAELRIPRVSGDPEDGEVAAFYFSADAGGVDANMQRWYGQFAQPDGRDSEKVAIRETLMAGNMEAQFIDLAGTMGSSSMPGRPATPAREGWRMYAAIVMSPNGPIFLKATGPDATMVANRDKMKALVQSVRMK